MNDGDAEAAARRDAALTLLVLVPTAVAAVVVDAPFAPVPLALGAVGAVVLELLLSLRAARVRALWSERRVQAVAVVVAIGGGIVLGVVTGPWVLVTLVGGLCAYLAVLLGSTAWRRRRNEDNA
jgi:hypothetical protein